MILPIFLRETGGHYDHMTRGEAHDLEHRLQRYDPTSWEAGANDLEAAFGGRAKFRAFVIRKFDAKGFFRSIRGLPGTQWEGRERFDNDEVNCDGEKAHGAEGGP